MAPFGQAAAQVSAQGAIHLGKRQSEELAVATAADFEAFCAARRPEPCDPATGLLLTADGSAFPVLPSALRPATAKAAAARAAAAAASGWPDDPVTCASPAADGRAGRRRRHPARPRTPADILAALFGPRSGGPPANPGPKAAGKTMFASVRKPPGKSSPRRSPRRTAATAITCGRGSPWWTATTTDRDHHHARRGLPGQGAHPDRPHSCDALPVEGREQLLLPR